MNYNKSNVIGKNTSPFRLKDEKSEKENPEYRGLDALSDVLTAASFILGLDTFTNLVSIPVDIARGDYFSAGLSVLGTLPIVGEVADAAKIAKTADKIADTAKFADNAIDAAQTAGKVSDAASVAKVTKHGSERLRERGFSDVDISNTKATKNIQTQNDGAKVYIKEVSPGKYNVVVEGDRGIITALKNINKKSLDRLTKNYNWR